MKKLLKWGLVAASVPLAIVGICASLLYIPVFQDWAVEQVSSYASEKTGMDISVDKVRLKFPLKLSVEGVKVIQPNESIPQLKDTITNIGKIVADVKVLPLLKKRVEIDQLDFHDAKINTSDFVKDARVKGNIGSLSIKSHGIDLKNHTIRIDEGALADANLEINLADSVPPDTTETQTPWKIVADKIDVKNSTVNVAMPDNIQQIHAEIGNLSAKDGNFDLSTKQYKVGKLDIDKSRVCYDDKMKTYSKGLDTNHLDFQDISISTDSISYKEDHLEANLRKASFKEKSELDVRQVAANIVMDDGKIKLKNALVETPDSRLRADFDMDMNTFDVQNPGKLNANVNLSLGKQDVMKMMGDVPPGFRKKWPNYPMSVNGVVRGNMDRLDFKGLNVNLPSAFRLHASGTASHLDDMKKLKADVDFQLKGHDLSLAKELLPSDVKKDINIPKNISMNGNVKANGNNYTADFRANEGKGKVSGKVMYNGDKETYTAKIDANQLQLQHFAPNYGLSPFTGKVDLQGKGLDFTSPHTNINLQAQIDQFKYQGYDLDRINANLSLKNGRTSANISSDNPLLKGITNLDAVLNKDRIQGTLSGDISHIDLNKLGISDRQFVIGGTMNLSFNSDMKRCHQLKGYIDNLIVKDERQHYYPDRVTINGFSCPDTTYAYVNCGDFHLDMQANSYYEDLLKTGQNLTDELHRQYNDRSIDQIRFRSLLPNARINMSSGKNNFIVKMLNKYGYGIKSVDLDMNTSSLAGINGSLHIDSLTIDSILLDTINFAIQSDSVRSTYRAQVRNNEHNPRYTFNALVDGAIHDKGTYMGTRLFDAEGNLGLRLGVAATLEDNGFMFRNYGKEPILGYTDFHINKDNYVFLGNDKRISADVVLKADNGTGIQVYSHDEDSTLLQDLTLSINKFDLKRILSVIPYMPDISGIMNGDFHIMQSEKDLSVSSNLEVGNLVYEKNPMGDMSTEFVYIPQSDGMHKIDGVLYHNGNEVAAVKGDYDSKGKGFLNANVDLKRMPLSMINGFIPDQIIGFKGYSEGTLSVRGELSKPDVNGEVFLDSAYLISLPYGVSLRFDNDPVSIKNSRLLFENFNMYANNESPLTSYGYFDFSDFDHMYLDMRMRADNFQIIDAKENARSETYGKAFVNFFGSMRGEVDKLRMRGRLDVLGSTDMTYILRDSPLSTDNQLNELVKFTDFSDTTQTVITRPAISGFDMDLTMDISKGAHVMAFLNADHTNYIDLNGGGTLRMQYNPADHIQIRGKYTLSNGEMKYSLPVIPLKTFVIQNGSYIEFTGDPMNPTLNIKAIERTKATVANAGGVGRSIDFDCGVIITKTLNDMGLEFILDSPEDMALHGELQAMSKEQRGKLAVSMLTTGMYLADGNTSAFTMNSALSSFLNNEINNITGNALRTLDLSFGLDNTTDRAGNSHMDYSFKFAKRFWNNRLKIVVGGKISSGAEIENQNQSFFDNVSMEYRLDNTANKYVSLFYKNNVYNWLDGYTQEYGGGFIWRRSLQHFKDIFRFKDEKQQTIPVSRDSTRNRWLPRQTEIIKEDKKESHDEE